MFFGMDRGIILLNGIVKARRAMEVRNSSIIRER